MKYNKIRKRLRNGMTAALIMGMVATSTGVVWGDEENPEITQEQIDQEAEEAAALEALEAARLEEEAAALEAEEAAAKEAEEAAAKEQEEKEKAEKEEKEKAKKEKAKKEKAEKEKAEKEAAEKEEKLEIVLNDEPEESSENEEGDKAEDKKDDASDKKENDADKTEPEDKNGDKEFADKVEIEIVDEDTSDTGSDEEGKTPPATDEEKTEEAIENEEPAQNTSEEPAVLADPIADDSEEYNVEPEVIDDYSEDAYYEERTYNPSEQFVDQAEKIKYSTTMPLENIPAFITQEMIIGALKCQDETGYPASVTIAQIIQESGFGLYGPNGDEGQGLSYLAFQYNNLFGIKERNSGQRKYDDWRTASSGENYTISAGFRVYNTYTECIEDRTELLKEVYSDLTEGVTDANTFAMQIGSRWATSLTYSQNLILQMETYDLYRLDKMTLKDFSALVGEFADPCPGSTILDTFGYQEWRGAVHKGMDFGTGAENIPTYAAAAGTVVTAGWSDSAGNWIVIDHGNGMVTKYMHHSKIFVEEGDKVEKGQQIGVSGTTGDSTGNHLHFQLEIDGTAVDPSPYLGLTEEKES